MNAKFKTIEELYAAIIEYSAESAKFHAVKLERAKEDIAAMQNLAEDISAHKLKRFASNIAYHERCNDIYTALQTKLISQTTLDLSSICDAVYFCFFKLNENETTLFREFYKGFFLNIANNPLQYLYEYLTKQHYDAY